MSEKRQNKPKTASITPFKTLRLLASGRQVMIVIYFCDEGHKPAWIALNRRIGNVVAVELSVLAQQ
jgi:hypothetical protein